MEDYPARLRIYSAERDALEADCIRAAQECETASVADRLKCSERCFALADQALGRWSARVSLSR
jgi:hypothetical protein